MFRDSPSPTSFDQGLAVHEWAAVCSLIIALLTIATCSFFNKYTSADFSEKISIFVTGAVVEPKKLELSMGSRIIDVLSSVELLNSADMEKIALDTPLRPNSIVVMPCREGVSLYVSGAVVKEGVIIVPEGARFHDLVNYITLAPQADKRWILRKKRVVKDGECICVPEKVNRENASTG